MHAIAGVNTYQTMRVTGKVKRRPLHILIDSGSTHNFLDIATAKTSIVMLEVLFQVSIANRAKLVSATMCKGFTWSLHGELFSPDVMLLPWKSCEMLLEVQWLATLG